MVANVTAMLSRFTREWATLLQPEAILGCAARSGIPHGATACSRRSPPCSSSCCRFCMATPPAVICPICRACGSVRRPTVKPAPDSRCASLLSSWSASAASVQPSLGRRAVAWPSHLSRRWLGCSMPDTPALQEAFGQPTEQRPGCGFPVAHLLGLFHAGTGVLLKLVVAPLLTHDLAQVQAVHPTLSSQGMCSWRIGACVPMPISPSSSRPACMPCSASARARLWISRRAGRLSGRACGGRLPSKAFHGPAGSKRSASMTNSWRG